MQKSTRAYFIAVAVVAAPLFWSGCSSGDSPTPTDPGATRKPFTIYYTVMSEGRRAGYAVVDFRTEDGKAVHKLEINMGVKDQASNITWERTSTQRCVETLDGRPLIYYMDIPGHIRRTYTVGADGRVQLSVTDYPTTRPAAVDSWEETTAWPEGAILWHGQYLLMRRKGMKEGTTYTFKQFSDGKSILMHARIGPRRKVELHGRRMELTELAQVWDKPPEFFRDGKPWKETVYLDDDLNPQKIEVDMGPAQMTMIACSKTEAMKLPKTAPMAATRPR